MTFLGGHFLDYLQKVVLVFRVFLVLYNENQREALVILGAIERRPVAKPIELEAAQSLDHAFGVESAGGLGRVGIEQRLDIAGLGSLGGREPPGRRTC